MSTDHVTTPARPRDIRLRLPALLAAMGTLLLVVPSALAYVGPGAGFAIGTTLLTVFIAFFSAVGALLLWPFRWLVRLVRHRRALAKARCKRFIVLGLDGFDARLTETWMEEGRLPNFNRLKEIGAYRRLGTTAPAMTPVAWSSFLTGCNPGKHNIFDFLTRDARTYLPRLSSVDIGPPRKTLKLGKYRLPLTKADVRGHRKGVPFWQILGRHGVFSNIIRMPITFPPEKFRGVLLSAMAVPDLRGSQGTFSFYSTAGGNREYTGGEQIRVERQGDLVRSHLVGPPNTLVEAGGALKCPFEVRILGPDRARLKIRGEQYDLLRDVYTPWVRAEFRAGLGIKVKGICEFLLLETEPEFRLYVTPIQIDPGSPALEISYPKVYATYFAKFMGPYATMGLAEDTWAMNAKILDDDAFLHQCNEADDERARMFFDALDKVRQGFIACVIDGPDRVNHMYWRYLDPRHPAHNGQGDGPRREDAIEKTYVKMDRLVGDVLARLERDPNTVLLVISDHGCASFRRGVDLNRWLEEQGYLKLQEAGRGRKYLQGVDWAQTRAYCIGLTGLWLNIKGRERDGIVEPDEAAPLRAEIVGKLTGLTDPETGEVAINRAYEAAKIYRGPYKHDAPDIIVGYNEGYRVGWEAALGEPTDQVFHDNVKAWSGDHIVDPRLVPGVLFSNRPIAEERIHITDLAPTVLQMFGVAVPEQMDGRPLTIGERGAAPRPGGPPAGERERREPVAAAT